VRHLGRGQDGLDGLLLGRVDEPAGVDDDDVGALGGRRTMAGGAQAPLERVGVRLVLGAAQGLDEERRARGGPGGAVQR
jgi:hypothetical protein